jgi:alkyl hydroperoxide reductase subunit AhpC
MCANSMGGVPYPVLADFYPHGKVSQLYDVFNQERGTPKRSIFVIDKEGIIRFAQEYQGSLPDPQEVLAEVDKITS